MQRRDLDSRVGKKLDLSAATVGEVLDTALELLVDELVRSSRLEWRGLGTFTVRTYTARKIHNPATGKTIALPERRSVTYKPSRKIRARLKPARRSRPAERRVKGGVKKVTPVLKPRKSKPKARGR